MKIGAIIQARSSSTRLPNKVLLDLPYGSKISVLAQIIRRLKTAESLNQIIVATTKNNKDDRIVQIARAEKVQWFRGSTRDILDRYFGAAKKNGLDIVVRITADCPCIDAEVVDNVVKNHLKKKNDFTTTLLTDRTFPHGIEVEVFSFDALTKAYKNAKDKAEREHLNLYIENNPKEFQISEVRAKKSITRPKIRVTLDTESDYVLLCAVFDLLGSVSDFKTKDLVKLFDQKPWLYQINKNSTQKIIKPTLDQELEEAYRILKLQELDKAARILMENIYEKNT